MNIQTKTLEVCGSIPENSISKKFQKCKLPFKQVDLKKKKIDLSEREKEKDRERETEREIQREKEERTLVIVATLF